MRLRHDEAYRCTQEIAEIETVDPAREEARDTRFNILRTVWKYAKSVYN